VLGSSLEVFLLLDIVVRRRVCPSCLVSISLTWYGEERPALLAHHNVSLYLGLYVYDRLALSPQLLMMPIISPS
jgi:hypothetical protein